MRSAPIHAKTPSPGEWACLAIELIVLVPRIDINFDLFKKSASLIDNGSKCVKCFIIKKI